MLDTLIQWADDSCNLTYGCAGCELWKIIAMLSTRRQDTRTKAGRDHICYAGGLTTMRGHLWTKVRMGRPIVGQPGKVIETEEQARDFSIMSYNPGAMAEAAKATDLTGTRRKTKPWLDGMPRTIFVSDMSDALSPGVPFDYLQSEIIQVVMSDNGRRHIWMWLTKQPARMAEFSEYLRKQGISWPVHLWAGTSMTTQATIKRAKQLLDVGDENTIRFLSVEPQWEHITLGDVLPRLNWIIQGGESGNGANAFDATWADALREECRLAAVPYFLKQFGSHLTYNGQRIFTANWEGGDWSEWADRFKVRQFPKPVVFNCKQPANDEVQCV